MKECMLDLAISYAILKSFTEIGRNFVAALCNSISLRLFDIDLLSEHTHSMGSWLRDLQILCIWKDFESGYFASLCEWVSMQACKTSNDRYKPVKVHKITAEKCKQ